MTESERLSSDELRTLVLFEKLSDDQLTWLADHGRVVEYPAGATIHAEGAPATCFLVLLSGMLAMSRRVQGGELELMRSDYRGSYTGAFNFYLVNPNVLDVYPATARAVKDCRLLELPAAELGKAFARVVSDGVPSARGLHHPGDGESRHHRASRAAGGPRLGDGRAHPRVAQPRGCRAARQFAAARDARRDAREARPADPEQPPGGQARGGRRPRCPGTGEFPGRAEPRRRWKRPIGRTR